MVNDHTVHLALTRRAGLRPRESVLVHGAAGGLGSAAVRIAAALGARATAAASSPQRRTAATAAGAHQVYGPDEWQDSVRADGGADIIVDPIGGIIDPIGGDVFDVSLRALAPRAGCSVSATSPAESRRPRRTGCYCVTATSEASTGAA